MTEQEEMEYVRRVGFAKTRFLAVGLFIKSKRFMSWDAEQQYRYIERVGAIDGTGPKISITAHVIACREIGEKAYGAISDAHGSRVAPDFPRT